MKSGHAVLAPRLTGAMALRTRTAADTMRPWAEVVFPDVDGEVAFERLWEDVAHICRLDADDPSAAWIERSDALKANAQRLTDRRFDALRLHGPGTDLTIGLFRSAHWAAGDLETIDGRRHSPNIPTEEVFGTPDPERVEGHVSATLPLELSGTVVDGIRVEFDIRENMKPGAKYFEWEALGVPVRLEIGPRDLASGQAVLARRTGGKGPVPLQGLTASVTKALDEIQAGLLAAARERREKNSTRGVTKAQFLELMQLATGGGFAYGGFCGNPGCEAEIKEQTGATVRVLPDPEFRSKEAPRNCMWCGAPSIAEAVWAQAY